MQTCNKAILVASLHLGCDEPRLPGLRNYADAAVRTEFTKKSYDLFLKEWREKGHTREDY
jgi:hypothetical protein